MVVNTQKLLRTLKIVLAVLITIGVVFGAAVALYLKGIADDPTKAFGKSANFVVTDDSGVTHEYNQGVVSFLIVGLDSSEERENNSMGYRADVIMVCVVDTNNKQASLISVPRDTKARVQVLNSEGKPTRMVTTRINAAFSYGFSPDKYGYQNTLDAVNDLFSVDGVKIDPITTYVGADMDDFVMAANLIGGVDLQLPHDVPGFGSGGDWIHLEGERALDYVRIRKGKGLTGMDTDRTERQRGFLRAVAGKMQQEGALKTVPKIYNECVREGYIHTNMTIDQMYAISASLEDIYLDTVVFSMLPGYINDNEGVGYWHVNKTDLKSMILDIFYNAQQGNGIPTALPTLDSPTSSRKGTGNTKTEYTYTKKKTSTSGTTTKKTTEKTTAKPTTTEKTTTAKTTTQKTTTKTTTKATAEKTTTAATTEE